MWGAVGLSSRGELTRSRRRPLGMPSLLRFLFPVMHLTPFPFVKLSSLDLFNPGNGLTDGEAWATLPIQLHGHPELRHEFFFSRRMTSHLFLLLSSDTPSDCDDCMRNESDTGCVIPISNMGSPTPGPYFHFIRCTPPCIYPS
jgi:hypothetical protein